jgi:tetrathionate reductase subunit B
MPTYAMVIRKGLCTGCQTCSVACKMENLTLPGSARTVIREASNATFTVEMCVQCENPPCVPVCPVEATWKNDQGVTVVDQETCIACGNCVEACPYDARCLNPERSYFDDAPPYVVAAVTAGTGRRRQLPGKADKCDFCMHLVLAGRVPMCVEACTTSARVFGDLDDPLSEVSRLVSEGAKQLRPRLATNPRVFYI